MKSEIINVSFNNKLSDLSYPIFVGTDLLSNCTIILNEFIQNRKIITYRFCNKRNVKTFLVALDRFKHQSV